MAFSFSKASVKLWRTMVKADLTTTNASYHRHSFATFTTPKFAPIAADAVAHHIPAETAKPRGKANTGEWIPIYILAGFLAVALSVGIHTAKQQLCHSPVVQVTKKKREMVPEVEDPNAVVTSSGKFINKSFLRKVAHIQDTDRSSTPRT